MAAVSPNPVDGAKANSGLEKLTMVKDSAAVKDASIGTGLNNLLGATGATPSLDDSMASMMGAAKNDEVAPPKVAEKDLFGGVVDKPAQVMAQ